MELYPLILLLSVIPLDWTTATEFTHGNYLLNIDNGTLKSVTAMGDPSTIDLSGLNITKIEEKIFDDLTGARTLDLSDNDLKELPPLIFAKLSNLETLSLANNRIKPISNTFVGLSNLKLLNLSNNSLESLKGGSFYGLTKLTDIIVEGNNLRSLQPSIFENRSPFGPEFRVTRNTHRTRIARNRVPLEYPESEIIYIKLCKTNDGLVESVERLNKNEELGNCTKIVGIDDYPHYSFGVLEFSGLGITKFQSHWYKFDYVFPHAVAFSHNNITEVTAELLNDLRPSVRGVDLDNNKIEIIKSKIISNHYLNRINLDNNIITTIEDGAFENTKLTSLALENNRLRSLKFAATLPSTLEKLIVSCNEISEIPDSLANLNELRYLNISRNNLNYLSTNVFRGLGELNTIDLSENQLTIIEPGAFNGLKELFTIHLSNNLISDINSGSLQGLAKAGEIHLQNNKLKKITRESFAYQSNDHEYRIALDFNEIDTIERDSFVGKDIYLLSISNNRLSERSIAKGAFNGSRISDLYLADNQFTMMNSEIFGDFPKFTYLSLSNNRIRSIGKGAVKYMNNLMDFNLDNNPIEKLQNGALCGSFKVNRGKVTLDGVPIKVIQGGLFDDV